MKSNKTILKGRSNGRIMKRVLMSLLVTTTIFYGSAQEPNRGEYNLLIGTYTQRGKDNGIFVYRFDSGTGELSYRSETNGVKNPSYLVISKNGKHVYAANELGRGNGTVTALSLDPEKGELSVLNVMGTGGDGPCYVAVDDMNRYVYAGNYGGGSLGAIPIREDGALGSSIQSIRHEGGSIRPGQKRPRVHATVLSNDNSFLYVPDLGTDKINIYKIDASSSNPMAPADQSFVSVEPGSGPRHFVFHPNGKFAYVVQELMGIVTAFDHDGGKLKSKQSVSLLSKTYKGGVDEADAADIHISPDGKFLYASLRGESNELVIYAIEENGMLEYVGRQSTLGKVPRNFVIDPSGRFVLVGNSASNEVVVFKRDQSTGLLEPTGNTISVPAPVCLKFTKMDL
ncbi:lactonase family protein [Flagellimonas olearia]|nr:lactonase family protein [Allomuricauda olearia]